MEVPLKLAIIRIIGITMSITAEFYESHEYIYLYIYLYRASESADPDLDYRDFQGGFTQPLKPKLQ